MIIAMRLIGGLLPARGSDLDLPQTLRRDIAFEHNRTPVITLRNLCRTATSILGVSPLCSSIGTTRTTAPRSGFNLLVSHQLRSSKFT